MKDLEQKLKGLKEAKKKTEFNYVGNKEAIVFRGTITLFSAASIAASSITLGNLLPNVKNVIMNESPVKGCAMILGVGVSTAIIPLAAKLMTYEMSNIKNHLNNIKYEKRWINDYTSQISEVEEEVSRQYCKK